MGNFDPAALVALSKKTFEDAEEAIVELEGGLTAEGLIDEWPLTEDRGLVRAKLLLNLGEAYEKRRQDGRSLNLEKALTSLDSAGRLLQSAGDPVLWAQIQRSLGRVYYNRARDSRAGNLENAIAALRASLTVFTRDAYPEDWAKAELNLANAYTDRIRGERAENIERAIGLYEAALEVYTCTAFPEAWAMTQMNLADAYRLRILGEKAENIERAIGLNETALTVYTREAFPEGWAKTQNNLATAYWARIHGARAENLERAIGLNEAALNVYTREAFPEDWAWTQRNLAFAYNNRIRGDRAENIERAVGLFEAALEVYTREVFPRDWAWTQMNLATAYWARIRGERAENLERAIGISEAALGVFSREALPEAWARTQNNLAIAYMDRIRGARAENLERAIGLCAAVLEVHTREAYPEEWARMQANLATAYFDRIRGARAENLERAIGLNEAALTVRTREAFPQSWAMTQMNLASGYTNRIRGEKAENIERAIDLYEEALTVRTREAFPEDWAMTQLDLATAYFHRFRGERAENLERAIGLYETALEVYTLEAYPERWAQTHNNLANAYIDRVHGTKTDNQDQAITAFRSALTIYSREAFPRDHLETSRGLGAVLLKTRAFSDASEVLADARETFRQLLGEGLEEAEARGLIEKAGPLFSCAAYAASELGDNERAFALACEGKARLMATALRLQRLNLPPAQNARLDALRTMVREQSRALDQVDGTERSKVLDKLATLRIELSGLIALSNERSVKSDAMVQAGRICADGSILVAPIVTDIGGKLFLVGRLPDQDRPQLSVLELPNLRTDRVKALLRAYPANSVAASANRVNVSAADTSPGWLTSFARDEGAPERKRRTIQAVEEIGGTLWTLLGGPVEQALKDLGAAPDARLVFLPSGGLGVLPLGLAKEPVSGQRLVDHHEIIYAPSLDAIDGGDNDKGLEETVPVLAPSLAAIINPRKDLIYAGIEGAFVAAHFKDPILLDERTADPDIVLSSLKGRSHWHFSTHGIFDLDEARRSALAMAKGGRLSVGDLLEADDLGRPRLVVLSACETGLHDIAQIADEFIGFPGAFMTIGAKAVLGTLWPVDDCASALLMARFYDGHLKKELQPAAALREAQLWLRSATREVLSASVEQEAEESSANAHELSQLKAAIVGAASETVRFFAHDEPLPRREDWKTARPFAHPIYLGGFIMTGR